MSGYFSFGFAYPAQHELQIRVLFKSNGPVSITDLAREIKENTRCVPYPDVLAIICHELEFENVEKALRTEIVKLAVKRLSNRTSLHLVGFGLTGNAVRAHKIANDLPGFNLKGETFFDLVRSAGSKTLFSPDTVLVSAPSGFRFRKPSHKYSSHFIRTEEALGNSEQVEFIAFVLLKRIANSSSKDSLDVIFVDSMSIASIAYAIRQIYTLHGRSFRVESFHSHEGLQTLDSPVPSRAFCLISASSSMSLELTWIKKVQCDSKDVTTLITLDNATNSEKAIVALAVPPGWCEKYDDDKGLRDLQILGERFYPQQLPIKRAMLALAHGNEHAKTLAKVFWNAPLLSANVKTGERIRALCVSDDVLTSQSDVSDWLAGILEPYAATPPQAIIYQNDDGSKKLADLCSRLLNIDVPIINGEVLESTLIKIDRHQPLLIVGAVVSRGTLLQAIARDLRDKHVGPEHFLIVLQLCETFAQIGYLKSSLVQSKNKNHSVDAYLTIPTGNALGASYQDETTLFRECSSLSSALKSRAQTLVNLSPLPAEESLLPSASMAPMFLRPDFAFWDDGYTQGESLAPLVLLTVGAALQSARELEQSASRLELRSNAMQQVVLDPLVFMRYNDGIIQAAILRQAYPSELDYSALPEQSRTMRTILEGQVRFRSRPQGEAVLEFALALKINKLRLATSEREKFETFCLEELGSYDADAVLSILMIQATREAEAEF